MKEETLFELDLDELIKNENKYINNNYYDKFFSHFNNQLRENHRHEKKTKIAKSFHENFLHTKLDNLEFRHGVMDALRNFINTYQSIGITRSAKQTEFHEIMIATIACSVYGGDIFKEFHKEICKRYGWSSEDTFHMLSIYAARRFGKTVSTSLLGTAILATCPNAEINIFAPHLEQAQMLLEHIKKYFFMRCPDFKIIKANDRHFVVKSPAGDVRKVHAWPKGVNVSLCNKKSYCSSTFFSLYFFSRKFPICVFNILCFHCILIF